MRSYKLDFLSNVWTEGVYTSFNDSFLFMAFPYVGFAYLEFQNEAAVENAVKMDGSEFKGRQLKVTHKRVNVPAFQLAGRGGGGRGGRGFRGRGRGRGFRGGGRGGGYYPY